jgi:organic hydroperoxide reductase OsmC/OhrA
LESFPAGSGQNGEIAMSKAPVVHEAFIRWTGNRGTGTSAYRAYDRNWSIETPGKAPVLCSNDPALGGDPSLHNPEDLLIASLSACHMLWYLHLCAVAKVVVTHYEDGASGEMVMERDGSGRFVRATLRPQVTITRESDPQKALALHGEIGRYCFIARSVNFPVEHEPQITVSPA